MSLDFLISQVTMERGNSWLLCHLSLVFVGVPDLMCNVYFLFLSFLLVCEMLLKFYFSVEFSIFFSLGFWDF